MKMFPYEKLNNISECENVTITRELRTSRSEVFSFSPPRGYRGWDLGSQSRAIKSAVARKPSSIGTDRGDDVPDHSVNESQASQKPASELSLVPRLHAAERRRRRWCRRCRRMRMRMWVAGR